MAHLPDGERSDRLLAATLAVALMLWLAGGISVAVAAISAFPVLAERGATVPGLEALAAADPAASGRMVAGLVMDRVFAITDLAQAILAGVAMLLAAILAWRRRGAAGGPTSIVLLCCVLAAASLVAAHQVAIAPPLQAALAEHRELAMTARLEDAERARRAFDSLHALADRTYGLRLLAVAAAFLLLLLLPPRATR